MLEKCENLQFRNYEFASIMLVSSVDLPRESRVLEYPGFQTCLTTDTLTLDDKPVMGRVARSSIEDLSSNETDGKL